MRLAEVSFPARRAPQDGAGLGFAGGRWGQQQTEVAVPDPAGLQGLAERVGAELVHCPPPAFLTMLAG
jgi:hypothetical protein